MKMRKGLAICILLGAFFVMSAAIVYAAIQNGVVTTHFNHGSITGENVNHFLDYNPTSTSYVYNDAGGTSTVSGSIDLRNYKEERNVQIAVTTLGSTSVTARVEGKSVAATTWGLIFEKEYTAVGNDIINILEKTDEMRVGLKVNTNGVDVVSVLGQYHSK